jgi:hypothetical protein
MDVAYIIPCTVCAPGCDSGSRARAAKGAAAAWAPMAGTARSSAACARASAAAFSASGAPA